LIKFPATLYGHYGSPLKLWLLARAWDAEEGCSCGRVFLSLESASKVLNRSIPTLRRWLREGKELGLFRSWRTHGDRLEIYYRSWFHLARDAGMENLGAIAWIEWGDLEHLELTATEAIALGLQRESFHAAKMGGVVDHLGPNGKVSMKFATKEDPITGEIYGYRLKSQDEAHATSSKFKKKIKKNETYLKPIGRIFRSESLAKIFNSPVCESGSGVLGVGDRLLFVSEKFTPYGGSQQGIADRRNLSRRQVQRHLQSEYRRPSPVRKFHKKAGVVCKRQIAQRLPRRLNGLDKDLRRGGETEAANRLLRNGDRLFRLRCNLYAPEIELKGVRSRRKSYKRFLCSKSSAPGCREVKEILSIEQNPKGDLSINN
jgi:hypothetical protein